MDQNSHFHDEDEMEMEIIEIGDSDGEGDGDSNSTGVQGESGHNSIRNGAGSGRGDDQSEESKTGGKTGDSEKIVIDSSSDNNKVIPMDSMSNSNSCSSSGLGGGGDKSDNNSVKNGFENLRTVITATSTGFKNVPKLQPSATGQTASRRYLIQKQQQSRPLDGGLGLGGPQPLFSIPDDTFLIEAPSFIVPYVFEQSGEKQIKDTLKELEQAVKVEKERKVEAKEELNHNDEISTVKSDPAKSVDYFQSPVGKLLMGLGMNLVQEYVKVDLLKMQKQKAETEKRKNRAGVPLMKTQQSILSLKQNIEESKENNEPFRHKLTKCSLCNFKSESEVVMATHLETPHIQNNRYRCSYCLYTTIIPQEILFHTEAEHCIKSKLETAPAIHQCPTCFFEDNSKAKLTRHLVECTKRFKIEKNLEPPFFCDTPAKLKIPKNRLPQVAFINSAFMGGSPKQTIQQHQRNPYASTNKFINQQYQAFQQQQQNKLGGSNLPTLMQAPKQKPLPVLIRTNPKNINSPIMNVNAANLARGGMMINNRGMPQANMNYQLLQQMVNSQMLTGAGGHHPVGEFLNKIGMMQNNQQQQQIGNQRNSSQPISQPISITSLPHGSASQAAATLQKQQQQAQPPQVSGQVQSASGGTTSFVMCEICDGYSQDLNQLRNHMEWIHNLKIHPKMIYLKPPLNCQKCQFRFFTDQGLERHLLVSHGLVTSSMQDAANKGQDSGRCPLCGQVYQWKLVAHVANDHNVTLRPANISYKCTVCTATFGTYKLFESHVYSAHSSKSKKKNNNNSTSSAANSSNSSGGNENKIIATNGDVTVSRNSQISGSVTPSSSPNSLNKRLKINEEITIIPLPLVNASAFKMKKVESSGSPTITPQFENNSKKMRLDDEEEVQIIEIKDTP